MGNATRKRSAMVHGNGTYIRVIFMQSLLANNSSRRCLFQLQKFNKSCLQLQRAKKGSANDQIMKAHESSNWTATKSIWHGTSFIGWKWAEDWRSVNFIYFSQLFWSRRCSPPECCGVYLCWLLRLGPLGKAQKLKEEEEECLFYFPDPGWACPAFVERDCQLGFGRTGLEGNPFLFSLTWLSGAFIHCRWASDKVTSDISWWEVSMIHTYSCFLFYFPFS